MAYNNFFPASYQNPYYQQLMGQQQPVIPNIMQQQQQQQQPQAQGQNTSGLTWVQGPEGAKSYLVAPNTTVQLWDSENPVIYLKSADASGMPSMKILDYTVRDGEQTKTPITKEKNDFVTRDEFAAFKEEIKAEFNNFSKSEVTGNEQSNSVTTNGKSAKK